MRYRKRMAAMRRRKEFLTEAEKAEIIDLFELSPMTVTNIAFSYNICRNTVYRMMWRRDGSYNVKAHKKWAS